MSTLPSPDSIALTATLVRLAKLQVILKSKDKTDTVALADHLRSLNASLCNLKYFAEAFQIPLADDSIVFVLRQTNSAIDHAFLCVKVQYPTIRMGVSPRWYRKMAVRTFDASSSQTKDLDLDFRTCLDHVKALNACFVPYVSESDDSEGSDIFDDKDD